MELITPSSAIGMIVMLLIFALAFLLPLLALLDVLRNEFTNSNKLIWILIVLLLPFIGPIIYFIIGSKQKIK
ncbi:PLDc N-terminal domain-containing protein [Labilibaculum antarcticum]|uniref:PLDc N-terminal domain-containing protein n=1 Tax=Labilibaculum antarcticum TaxID=1717717 RepID=UPI000BBB0C99